MMNPYFPSDDWPADDDCLFSPTLEEVTLTGQLRRFHNDFDSSTRAILQDCLFRVLDEEGVVTLQILCPNQAVRKRLFMKREKIRLTIRWIWRGTIDQFALCVEKNGLECQVFDLNQFRGGI